MPSERGVKMVVGEHEIKKRKSDKNPTTRSNDEFRCSRGSPRGLGGSLRESVSGRSMDQGREEGTHKCARIKNCVISHKNVHKEHKSEIHSPSTGQSGCSSICDENGSSKQSETLRLDKRNLEIFNAKRDHSYCRIYTICPKQRGRLPVKECERLERLETKQTSFQRHNKLVGDSNGRPVCIQDFTPTTKVLQLETRPILSGIYMQ